MKRNENAGSGISLLAVLALIGALSFYAIERPSGSKAPIMQSAGALLNIFSGR